MIRDPTPVREIDDAERRARLVLRHRLAPAVRGSTPLDAARAVGVLHATDAVTVFLSVAARTDATVADVEHALYEERSLVRMLGMRRTLFVVPRELVPVVFAAATRAVAARERTRLEGFLRDSGIARPGAWLAKAEREALAAVAALGEASTREVGAAVPLLARKLRLGAGTRWEVEQTAAARVLPQLAMQGLLVRARPPRSWTSPQFRWATTESWLGGPIPELDAAEARAQLVGAWLRAFGPATEADLRWWGGWTARDVRAALGAVGAEEVALGSGGTGLVLPGDDAAEAPPPDGVAALLPTLDATVMGWKERDWYLGPHAATLFDRNGNAGPTIWWEGRVVGGWSRRPDGGIALGLLEDVGAEARAAIDAEAERIGAWLGEARFSPGFLPPFQRALARGELSPGG
jgi:hypothetical protein